jgi:3-oxoacyl-(acyl-carrier-protein) synthase
LSRIFITGMGIITAIGDSVAGNRLALKGGRSGINTNMDLFPSRYAGLLPFGIVHHSTAALKEKLQITAPGVTRTSLLALHAFEEAVRDSNLSSTDIAATGTAFIGASTVGGMCLTDELYGDAQEADKGSAYLESYDSASVQLFIQQRYGMKGFINTINTACSSSANAIMNGAQLINQGWAKRAIVGGVDSLAKFTVNGFHSLHILSHDLCTPFDINRKGLNLGEGAAFIVLEKEEDLNGKKVYAELTGYANSNDAFHPSSLSEQGHGPFLSMQGALKMAGLQTSDIDFINAHGTGTENNDEVESRAMLRLFGTAPAFASTKANVGHTLGAAGAVEAVYSILNIAGQELYPQLNFTTPIPATGLSPVKEYGKKTIRHVMSNSFGFGGNCSSLVFSKA